MTWILCAIAAILLIMAAIVCLFCVLAVVCLLAEHVSEHVLFCVNFGVVTIIAVVYVTKLLHNYLFLQDSIKF